jgi:hypothetical protein
MVDIISEAGKLTGIGQGGGDGIGGGIVILFLIITILFAGICAVGTWFFVRWWQYKFKIVIHQRINGQFQETARRKARVVPVGKGGDQAIFLNKPKKILPMPTIQSGKNTFNYFISDDGEWINFSFGDFDEDRREVGSQFLDKEMRYARTSLQHMGEERYAGKGFWEKYGGMVAYAVLILVTCIGMYLIVDKMVEFNSAMGSSMDVAKSVLEKADQILGKVDSINSGGSGLKSAT